MGWIAMTFSFRGSAASTPRVGVWRRLKRLGAVSPSHGLYVLPRRESCVESAQWLSQEVEQAGGDALVMYVEAFAGLDDDELVAQFRAAAAERYEPLQQRLAEIRDRLTGSERDVALVVDLAAEIGRVQAEFDDLARVDYFDSPDGRTTAATIDRLRQDLAAVAREPAGVPRRALEAYSGRTWVTRPRPYIDRVACAWLIRRFVDPDAEIRYRARPQANEVPFDMPSGEFRHVGNLCALEVMLEAFGLDEPGLRPIAEIVHEIDLRDGRYVRPETHGIEAVLSGWHAAGLSDAEIEQAAQVLFDGLYGRFRAAGEPRPARRARVRKKTS